MPLLLAQLSGCAYTITNPKLTFFTDLQHVSLPSRNQDGSRLQIIALQCAWWMDNILLSFKWI